MKEVKLSLKNISEETQIVRTSFGVQEEVEAGASIELSEKKAKQLANSYPRKYKIVSGGAAVIPEGEAGDELKKAKAEIEEKEEELMEREVKLEAREADVAAREKALAEKEAEAETADKSEGEDEKKEEGEKKSEEVKSEEKKDAPEVKKPEAPAPKTPEVKKEAGNAPAPKQAPAPKK